VKILPSRSGCFRLGGGAILCETWVSTVRNPAIVTMIAAAGFDAVLIDTEHGAFSPETVSGLREMARHRASSRSCDRNGQLVISAR
jgi:2-keto-3-deoxy-L-rhamnonate aldolase RhmA